MKSLLSPIVLAALSAPAAAQPGVAPMPPPVESAPPHAGWPAPVHQPPPGSARATFMSTGETRFDVRLDNNAVCITPCAVYVEPLRYVTLHSHAPGSEKLSVGHLPAGDVIVQAEPRQQGKFAAGVTFTTFSGMGLATGITLTAVGCSTDRDTMCRAGLITGVASGAALYLSINLIREALPKVHVGPAQPYVTGNTVGLAGRF